MADVYDIGTPTQVTSLGPRGEVVEAYEIPFTARKSGASGTIKIPKSMFTADEVDRLVRAEVTTLDEVASL